MFYAGQDVPMPRRTRMSGSGLEERMVAGASHVFLSCAVTPNIVLVADEPFAAKQPISMAHSTNISKNGLIRQLNLFIHNII